MDILLFVTALVTVASAVAVVRAHRPMTTNVALGIHALGLTLLLAALSMPLMAAVAAVLGVGTVLVFLITYREAAPAEVSSAVWPLVREIGLLCLVLLFWWWLRRPTFMERLVDAKFSAQRTEREVLALLYTRYAGAVLGVGLMLLAAAIGSNAWKRDH
ncbi:MAG: hypothetical protein U9R48_00500 [Chloroflexota bacterium]|nr:hypothetical protein [Chloroflexota bacterium]